VAAKPIADAVKVPLVGPLAYAEALYDPVGPYMFPLWPSQQSLFQALTDFAIKEKGAKRIAVMANDGTVGNETIAGAKAAAAASGGAVVVELRVPNAQPDYSGVMTQVNNARPDAVVVQADTASMAKMLGDARRVGLTAAFYGGVSAGDQGMAKLAGPTANGSFGVVNIDLSGSAPGWSEYTASMAKYTTADPGTSFAASGYVAGQVLLQAIAAVKGTDITAASVTKALEGNDFATMAGPVRFAADNHLGVPKLLLTEVRDAQVTLTGTTLTVTR
jgi:branched-chain amino acid transport system substrate-binding protein